MKTRLYSTFHIFLFLMFFLIFPLSAQDEGTGDVQFNAALKSYVKQLLVDFGKDAIHRERFLIQQIRMINDEIKSRVTNIAEIRQTYFERLQNRLAEVRALKQRLSSTGSLTLNSFIDELEKKIRQTINLGSIDFKRQKVIEDAIQLMYIAEEMIKIDPGARLEDDPKFSKDLNNTEIDFIQSFGDDNKMIRLSGKRARNVSATIFDVYKEWKKTERIKYEVRWTDIQIIKNRLIKNAAPAERARMLKRELFHSGEMFNFGYYKAAEKLFEEILIRYEDTGIIDECLYYKAEANYLIGRYNKARDDFNKFVQQYPSSVFTASAYKRLMNIAYHFSEYDQVLNVFRSMRVVASSSDPQLEEATLLAAISGLKGGYYEETVSHAFEILTASEYYKQAQFILAEAYAGAHNFEESEKTFTSLLQISGLSPDFRFTILLKLGYLSYEMGNPYGAISYFDQIAGMYKRYDRVLIGYGWAYYKIEIEKGKGEKKDFTYAKKYLELLVDAFFGSDYYLEATTLLGYIYQMEQNTTAALGNYEYAFKSKDVKFLSDKLITERDKLQSVMKTADKLQKKALAVKNISAYHRADMMKKRLKKPLIELSYLDLSSTGVASTNEISRLKKQIIELDRLKKLAEEKGRKDLITRIEDMQLKIYRVVNSIPIRKRSKFGVNYFDEHPFARKESIIESGNSKILSMRKEVKTQREEIIKNIARLDVDIQNAKGRKDYKKMITLELSKERFEDLAKKLDYLESRAYSFDIKTSDINLNHWSDYGAFGMANVNFAIKNYKADRISYMQKQIDEINTVLIKRKENIEHKIELIENEITVMTRRVRKQERLREREELNRQFEETYFDTHKSEEEEYNPDTTQPPKFDIEPED